MQCKDVTIGIPAYNEERFIESTVRSAMHQCETLLVSDNASTDDSYVITKALCDQNPVATCIRQEKNIGALENFKFLLQQAGTPYFMWLGSHDLIPDGYVEKLKQALVDDPDAVMAYGASEHITVDGLKENRYDYFYSPLLAHDAATMRIMGLIEHLTICSLIHGVFRTEFLKNAWIDEKCLGVDHVLLTKAALKGKFLYVPETHLIRRDMHANDVPENQLARITGDSGNGSQPGYVRMQQLQYELACQATNIGGASKFFYLLKVRSRLVIRFGPFSKHQSMYRAEAMFYFVYSRFKRLANFLASK